MIYDPKRYPGTRDDLVRARRRGAQLITGLFGIGLFASEVRRLGSEPLTVLQYAYLTLFLAAGGLAYFWLSATEDEMDQLFEWLDPIPSITSGEKGAIFGVAVTLCALLYSARDPLLFGSVFTLYSVVVLLSTRHVNVRLSKVFAKCREHISREPQDELSLPFVAKALGIFEGYYDTNRHLRRHVAILVVSAVATAVAAYAKARHSDVAAVAAYGLVLLTLIISEGTILMWRVRRNAELTVLKDQMAGVSG